MPLFCSCVPGKPVTRYGSSRRGVRGTLIGAERVVGGRDNQIQWFPERIVQLPDDELRRYGREYRRVMSGGELRTRTEAEWRAQQRADDEAPAAKTKGSGKGKEQHE